LTRREITSSTMPIKRLDYTDTRNVQSVRTGGGKLREPSEGIMRWDYWNSPFYKPKTKICEDAWYEFSQAARMLLILDTNRSKAEKASENYVEPDVYAVFNKMRQDLHNELPYSRKFLETVDKQVERAIAKEMKLERVPS
jgi:hypothetical protein